MLIISIEVNSRSKGQQTAQKCSWLDSPSPLLNNSNPQFDSIKEFKNGVGIVQINNKYGLINKKGEYIIEPKFDKVRQFVGV